MTDTTRSQMIAAGKRNLATYERRAEKRTRLGMPAMAAIIRGSMAYLDAKLLAAGKFRVHGEAA